MTPRRVGLLVGGVVLAVWAGAVGVLLSAGVDSPRTGDEELIIVLGCRTLPDGTPSLCLRRRTQRAVQLWQQGAAPALLTTGGVGEGPVAEGTAAAAFATSQGVPADVITVEDRSTSTLENALLSRPLTAAQRVIIVTDAPHAWRARCVFAGQYASVGVAVVHRPGWATLPMAMREVFAVGYYAARGRLDC